MERVVREDDEIHSDSSEETTEEFDNECGKCDACASRAAKEHQCSKSKPVSVPTYHVDDVTKIAIASWFNNPKKYCFARFKPHHEMIFSKVKGAVDDMFVTYDPRPEYNDHFEYFLAATSDNRENFQALNSLLEIFPGLLNKTNNFNETALHFAELQ